MNLLDDTLIDYSPRPHKRGLESSANKLLKVTKVRRGRRLRHKPKIPRMTYRVYIKSKYWRKRKNDYFGRHGKACTICGKKSGVTLHHKIYDATLYGKEPDKHLTALCGTHHWQFHENHETEANMRVATEIYVAHTRQFEEFEHRIKQFAI